jgi:hypothetical protein
MQLLGTMRPRPLHRLTGNQNSTVASHAAGDAPDPAPADDPQAITPQAVMDHPRDMRSRATIPSHIHLIALSHEATVLSRAPSRAPSLVLSRAPSRATAPSRQPHTSPTGSRATNPS